MKKRFLGIGLILVLLAAVCSVWVWIHARDRHPGYVSDLTISPSEPRILSAGFAALNITPEVPDAWNDAGSDARFRPKDGDTFEDGNGNGRFDPVWMAGYQNARAAMDVHDDLWVRAAVFDDGRTRIALASIDAIGLFYDDVIDVRRSLPVSAGLDYAIVACTHDHESPDLLGLWGKNTWTSGIDRGYLAYVKRRTADALVQAAGRLRPARLKFAQDLTGAIPLVNDTREPNVLDPGLRVIQVLDSERDTTLGVLAFWGNHPETLGRKNLRISSDYPHTLRESIEKGVWEGNKNLAKGIGGVAVFVNGAVGGLMSTGGGMPIRDPFRDTTYTAPGFDKIRAQGQRLALLALKALQHPDAVTVDRGSIGIRTRTIRIALKNKFYLLAVSLGVLNRGFTGWATMKTEVAVWTLGPASFACVPGELYPEIANGGVEAPEGRDFSIEPVEHPPLRSVMPGKYQFLIGLANDEIGYILPKSQWDEKPPFTYGRTERPYGEVNSTGPETGPIIHRHLLELIRDVKK